MADNCLYEANGKNTETTRLTVGSVPTPSEFPLPVQRGFDRKKETRKEKDKATWRPHVQCKFMTVDIRTTF